jgi:hypothetical protein
VKILSSLSLSLLCLLFKSGERFFLPTADKESVGVISKAMPSLKKGSLGDCIHGACA